MISLRKRFFKHTALVVFMTMMISAVVIERHYVAQISEQAQQSLRLHIYALLSVAFVEDEQLAIPTILSNPELNTVGSGIWAVMFDQSKQVLWQSLSSPEQISGLSLPETSGRWQFGEQSLDNKHYLTASYSIVWNDTTEQTYHLLVAEDEQVIATTVANFRRKLTYGVSVITLFLLLFHYLVLRSAFRPIAKLEREIYDMEQGELNHLSSDYPKELSGVATNLNALVDKEHNQRERYRSSMADLAHSLKTPITIITGELSQYPDNPTLQDALKRMNNSIEYQLQRAVVSGHKLLAQGTPVLTVLNLVLEAMEKIHSDKQVEVLVELDEQILFYGDENDLLEVLGNLLDNAYKYGNNQIKVSAAQTKWEMTLVIEDNGAGFSKYDQTRIFQRGERLDQQGLGQGIGLAVVYDILKGYNGDVLAESSPLGGAKFRLTFPRLKI